MRGEKEEVRGGAPCHRADPTFRAPGGTTSSGAVEKEEWL